MWREEGQRAVAELQESEGRTLPTEFWSEVEQGQEKVIWPWLLAVTLAGVLAGFETFYPDDPQSSLGVVWDMVNLDAAGWAREYGYDLIRGITDTTRRSMQAAMGDWIEAGEALPDLIDRVEAIFGHRDRAELIATTETTRAYAEGNNRAWVSQGVQPSAYSPPAHPRCRCYEQPKLLPDGTWVIVWYTVVDRLVCKIPLSTPWGEIVGCAGMHGRVISEGAYGGLLVSEAEALARQSKD